MTWASLRVCCLPRLPGEVLVRWRRHGGDVQQLLTCPVPVWILWRQQDGRPCTGGQVPQRRPCWGAQGKCRLPGQRHPVGVLDKTQPTKSFKMLLLETVGRCVYRCICMDEVKKWSWQTEVLGQRHLYCFYFTGERHQMFLTVLRYFIKRTL